MNLLCYIFLVHSTKNIYTNTDLKRRNEIILTTLEACERHFEEEDLTTKERMIVANLINITRNSFFKDMYFIVNKEILRLIENIKYTELLIGDKNDLEMMYLVYFLSTITNSKKYKPFSEFDASKIRTIVNIINEVMKETKLEQNDLFIAKNVCHIVLTFCDELNTIYRSNVPIDTFYTVYDIEKSLLYDMATNQKDILKLRKFLESDKLKSNRLQILYKMKNTLQDNFKNRVLFCPYKLSNSKVILSSKFSDIKDFKYVLNKRWRDFSEIKTKQFILEYYNNDIVLYTYTYIIKILGELNFKWFECRIEKTNNEFYFVVEIKEEPNIEKYYKKTEIMFWNSEEMDLLKMSYYLASVGLLTSYRDVNKVKNKFQSVTLARYYLMKVKFLYESLQHENINNHYERIRTNSNNLENVRCGKTTSDPNNVEDIRYEKIEMSLRPPCDIDKIYKKSASDIYFCESLPKINDYILNTKCVVSDKFDKNWAKKEIIDNLAEIYNIEINFEQNEMIKDIEKYREAYSVKEKYVNIINYIEERIKLKSLVKYNMFMKIPKSFSQSYLEDAEFSTSLKKYLELRKKNLSDKLKLSSQKTDVISCLVEKYAKKHYMDMREDFDIILWACASLIKLHQVSDEDLYNECFLKSLKKYKIEALQNWSEVKKFMLFVECAAICRALEKKDLVEICYEYFISVYRHKEKTRSPLENIIFKFDT